MATKTLYKVQVGAYKVKENAEKMANKLRKRHFPAVLVKVDGLWKVQSGAFSIKENADQRVKDLKNAGYDAIMVTVPGSNDKKEPVKVPTGWNKVLKVLNTIVSAKDPHQKVVDILKKHGHTLKPSSAWCSETVVAAFLEAGYEKLIGGYAADAPSLKRHAKNLGIWHDGSSGIKAGDIVLYGSGTPNHTEIAIDSTYNISGNYNGTAKKRKRSGRKIHGYIRPKYPTSEPAKKEDDIQHKLRVRFWAIRFWESDPEKYGDASVFIQYGADGKSIEHVFLVDTGMNNSDTIKKLKKAGVTHIDAILISHDHSDHYGYLESILKTFKVDHVYFPDQTGVKKYQPEYANRISKQAAKCVSAGAKYSYLKPGDEFKVGDDIWVRAIFMADPSKLPEKEDHHFINNMSIAVQVFVGKWTFHMAGDMQSDAIKQMLAHCDAELNCDVFKIQWHGDRGGITIDLANALFPSVAVSNYHGPASSGGRKSTYKVLENVGCLVMENYKDGEVYMDILDDKMTVSGSKTGIRKVVVQKGV